MSTKNYRLLPTKLQELRKNKQLNQKRIAQAIGISEAMYSRIESGERALQHDQIDIVAIVLEADIKELRSLCLADKLEAEAVHYSSDEINLAILALQKPNSRV